MIKTKEKKVKKKFDKRCLRCNYEWLSAIDRPKQCPACKQPAWDRPARGSKLRMKSPIEAKQDSIFDTIGKVGKS